MQTAVLSSCAFTPPLGLLYVEPLRSYVYRRSNCMGRIAARARRSAIISQKGKEKTARALLASDNAPTSLTEWKANFLGCVYVCCGERSETVDVMGKGWRHGVPWERASTWPFVKGILKPGFLVDEGECTGRESAPALYLDALAFLSMMNCNRFALPECFEVAWMISSFAFFFFCWCDLSANLDLQA